MKVVQKQQRKTRLMKGETKSNIEHIILILPATLLIAIFCYIPMFGIILAFKRYNPVAGIFASPWVGFDNFKFFFKSSDFVRIMRNTIGYSLWFQILTTITNMGFAIMLYNVTSRKALKYFQTTAILPSFMSIVLISYIVFAFLNPTDGLVNRLIHALGGSDIDWYNAPGYWPVILSVVKVWNSVGMGSLYYYSAMLSIDESLIEAAKIDGANKWQEIRYIIIPEMMSLVCLFLILGISHVMNGDFGLHYQITRNVGTLYPTTDILQTYVFRALQDGSSMGRTTAVGLFGSVIGTILLIVTNTVVKKIDPDKSLF